MNLNKLPILPVKDLVAFPHIYTPIFVGREVSKLAVQHSMASTNSEILIVLQKNGETQEPSCMADLHQVGVVCKIVRFEKSPVNPETYKLLVQGLSRIKLTNVTSKNGMLEGVYETIPEVDFDIIKNVENKTLYETLVKDLVFIIEKGFVSDGLIPVKEIRNPVATCYLLLYITKEASENQAVLESENGKEIVRITYEEILKQKNQIEVKENINDLAKENMTKSQKEYILKEQMRAIRKELGEDSESDLDSYNKKYKDIENYLSDGNKKEIQKNLKKLKNASSESYEVSVIKNYLDYVFELPWGFESKEKLDIEYAKEVLNKKHSYLDDVKERILEFLSVRQLNPNSKAPIICFAGPPGVGKCVKTDSLVIVDGVLKRIGNLSENRTPDTFSEINHQIQSDTGVEKTDKFFWVGKSKTKKITLTNGLELEGRFEHPVKILNKVGECEWKRLDQVAIDDVVLTRLGADSLVSLNTIKLTTPSRLIKEEIIDRTPEFMSEDLALFLGYLVGDGGWNEDAFVFHQDINHQEVYGSYTDLHKKLFGFEPSLCVTQRQPNLVNYQTVRKYLVRFLNGMGFENYKNSTKLINGVPDSILNGGSDIWTSFLAGVFDTDGSIDPCGSVELTMHSKKLMQDIQVMLWSLGIPSDLNSKEVNGEYYWRVTIVGGERTANFNKITAKMVLSYKRDNFKPRGQDNFNPSRFGHYHNVKDKVVKLWRESFPISRKDQDNNYFDLHYSNKFFSHTSYNKVSFIVGEKGDSQLKGYLDWLYNSMVPLKIEKIEDSESEVCDVVVPSNHTFISNGIVSHNTSFAQSIAAAIGRESIRISLGGVKDESEIRGHRKTYVGAMPGKIMQGIRQAGTKNPVFILDEIDKLSNDFRGDPSAALLEVLDPEQNDTFKDHYINLEFDLSKVMFIATANNLESIPGPLMDRLELIKVSGYCEEEKVEIAKKFVIPKKVKEGGLGDKDVSFSDIVLRDLIGSYTKEFGVRELERQVFKIVRKVAKKKAENKLKKPVVLTKKNLKDFLGPEIYSSVEDNKNGLGIVTGLAWTPYGGEILKLEAIILEEKGDMILTGRLGEVMLESAKIGVSVIKDNYKKWGIDPNILKEKRIHIHAPAGATPKDGPSAGIALVSAMVSLLTGQKIKNSLAMTGEVTLTGKVWPVGGIREKVLAAIRSGIKLVILPKDNMKDFESIPPKLTESIEVKYVSHVSEVIKEIF